MDIHRCRFVDYTPHTITSTAFSHSSSSTQFASNDLRLAIGRSNGDIEIWNPKYNWTHELTLPGSRGRSIEGLCWSTTKDEPSPRLFSIGGSTYITEWDLTTGKPIINYDCNAGVIWSIDVNEDGDKLAVGCDDGSAVIVDISGGPGSLEHDLICQRQDLRILSIKWYGNEKLVSGCADARLRCWSAAGETRGRLMGTMRVDKSKTESTLVWSVIVLPQKRQIVSGDSTGSIKFWDLDNFTLLQSFKVHEADVLCLTSDFTEEKLFSAGVDRKIHQFDLITNKNKTSKWVHSFSRLLHSNDVRSMSIYESKGCNFLISGGAERSVVIQSVQQFHDGKYRKLAISQQKPNVVIKSSKNLIIMWQDQHIKIWKVFSDEESSNKHKLVAKLTLADDENITSVSINEEATLLAVSRLTSLKVFELSQPNDNNYKLKVSKIRDETFDSSFRGAKKVVFYSNNKLLVLTPEEEILKFVVDSDNQTVSLENEIETVNSTVDKKSKLTYNSTIKNLAISKDSKYLAISRFNCSIEIMVLDEDESPYILTKLSSLPHLVSFTNNNTLLVLTEENKLYEFYIKSNTDSTVETLLTPWSKRNSEFLPKQFLTLEDKPQGLFTESSNDSCKIWIYGSTWLSFFDLSVNIPINKTYQNTSNVTNKKRNRDGLTIQNNNNNNDEENEFDGNQDIVEDNAEILELSLKQSQINRLRQKIQDDESTDVNDTAKPFWLTTKYRPIMMVDVFGNGIVVIERPSFSIPSTPAFNLPKLKV